MKTNCVFKWLMVLGITGLVFGSCSNDDDESPVELAGEWTVVYYIEQDTKITKADKATWPEINNGDITARFSEPDDKGEGNISGITVSNRYNGNYTVKENGEITISPVSSTLINEPEWTELFRISGAETYEIRGSKLFIYYNGRENTIVFERD